MNVVCLKGKSQIFCLYQAVISPGKLPLKHLGIFHTNVIELIMLRNDADNILVLWSMIHVIWKLYLLLKMS